MLANANIIDLVLLVAEAAAETSLEGGNMALAIFIPVLIISLLLGGAYIYLTRWDVQSGWGAGSRAPWGRGQGWLSIAVPLLATCPRHSPGELGTEFLLWGPLGAGMELGLGGMWEDGTGHALLWGCAMQHSDSCVCPTGVGTTLASACPSCTPTPTARSQ